MLRLVCFLPIPQSRAGFLRMLTRCLQMRTFTALGVCTGSQPRGWGGMDEARGVLEVPVSLLRESSGEVSPMPQGWSP